MVNVQLNRLKVSLNALAALVNQISPPVGSIIPYIGGYFADGSNGTFTMVQASLNDVASVNAVLPESWRVCDGAEFFDADSPIFNVANRFLPDLTDERFIEGFSAAGSIGGSNEMLDHIHTSSTEDTGHDHTVQIDHGHSLSGSVSISGGGGHGHTASGSTGFLGRDTSDNGFPVFSSDNAGTNVNSFGVVDGGGHSHGGSLSGSANVHSEAKTSSFISQSHSHTIGSGSIPASTDNRPKFLSTFYIMRVK